MSVLDGSLQAVVGQPAAEKAGGYRRTCPECRATFMARHPGTLFCSTSHKRAYNNRWLTRGAVLAPIYSAARTTRFGTRGDKATGSRATANANSLVQRWAEEDKAAGRLSTVEYMELRYRLGLVEVV